MKNSEKNEKYLFAIVISAVITAIIMIIGAIFGERIGVYNQVGGGVFFGASCVVAIIIGWRTLRLFRP